MKLIMRFSEIEKQHLLKAWVAISLAFAILMSNIISPEFIFYFIISLFTVGIGFLLHELAHKLMAQKYGCVAEFRADDKMLIFAVFSAFFGFIFAAPGAVLIYGKINKEKNGKISLAGPLTNFILALFFLIFTFILSSESLFFSIFNYGFQINSFIALFNLIPFMNLDGEKIVKWNKPIYFSFLILTSALVFIPRFL